MSQNRSKQKAMPSSSSEEETSEEKAEASESSSEDEFDSEDERVNRIPDSAEPGKKEDSAQNESSSESDGEDDTALLDIRQPANALRRKNFQTFESDVESEYDTESSSGSEGLTQKALKDVVKESPVEAMEAPRSSKKKKLQNPEAKRTLIENDELAENVEKKLMKQQKNDPRSKSAKAAVLENVQGSQTMKTGQGAVVDMLSDDSVRNDKKSGSFAKKRKLESSQHDTGRDSAGSTPNLKENRDTAEVDMRRVVKHKASKMSKDTDMSEPSATNKGADHNKPARDAAKELAKKTLNSANARDNGSTVSDDTKTLTTGKKIVNQYSPLKQKKLPHVWSVDEEIICACEILNHMQLNSEVPSKRNDAFWAHLSEILQEKARVELSKDKLCDKARRLKQKYQVALQKIEESEGSSKPFKHKSLDEQRLFDIMSEIWGKPKITNLEDQQRGDNSRKDSNKSIQTPEPKGKQTVLCLPESMLLANSDTGKTTEGAIVDICVDANANAIPTTSTKQEQRQAVNVDQRKDVLHGGADGPTLQQEQILATLADLQEWTKQTFEEWMTKAYTLIEKSTKRLEDQVKHASGTFITGGVLPMSFSNPMEIGLGQGENYHQNKWQELRLQELDVYAQRLELMRRECELKQEQIKVHLQQTPSQK